MIKLLNLLKIKFKKPKKDFWLFSAYIGKYDDSPKAISEYTHAHFPEINIYWILKKENYQTVPSYIKCLDWDNPKEREYGVLNASVIIDNLLGPYVNFLYKEDVNLIKMIKFRVKSFLCFRKKQIIYSFWHGIGTKLGMNERKDLLLSDASFGNIEFLLGSKEMVERFRAKTLNKGNKYLAIGSPRNDFLLSGNVNTESIKQDLHLPLNKKIVLFAPTFRGNTKTMEFDVNESGILQLKTMNISSLLDALKTTFGNEFVLVVRLHHLVEQSIDIDKICKESGGNIINGNLSQNMNKYLCVTDVLITDYSSSMNDFIITGKPIFLYAPDYYEYDKKYGLYNGYKELPFPICITFEELLRSIQGFNRDLSAVKYKNYLLEKGFVLEPNATKVVSEYIYSNNK